MFVYHVTSEIFYPLSIECQHEVKSPVMMHQNSTEHLDVKKSIWVWVNTYRYIFSGMNIHLPAILGFTRYQGFDPSPYVFTIVN